MAQSANRHRRTAEIRVGEYAWLSTDHLKLPQRLTRKLAPRFVGPFKVIESVTPVSFRLALPPTWRIHAVFHASQLKPAVGPTSPELPTEQVFSPGPDDAGEYEVEDILDMRLTRGGQREFRVLWKGYSIFESTWEPEANLANAPDTLADFCHRRGLPLRATASSRGE